MKTFAQLVKWQFVVLHRNNLIMISVVITAIYALIFYVIKGLGDMEKVLTLLIYNDPAVIGLFFVGLSIIIEKNQRVLPALLVSPVNYHSYLISKILALAIIGTLCTLGMVLAVYGVSLNFPFFLFGVFGTCLIFGIMGVWVVSHTTEFLSFVLLSIPVLLLLSVPLFNYFNVSDIGFFYFTPIQGSLNLITNAYQDHPVFGEVLFGVISIIFWVCVLYIWVSAVFKKKIINSA